MDQQGDIGETASPAQAQESAKSKGSANRFNSATGFRPFTRIPEAFSIGLKPLDGVRFLHVDDGLADYTRQKETLLHDQFADVMMWEKGSLAAQHEATNLLSNAMAALGYKTKPNEIPGDWPPLAKAALGVQDDLLILQPSEEGWRLTAACLCFPSSWNLAEKFGKPLEVIHAPVPHLAGKMNTRIRRIFDMLRPDQPLWRENWSLEGDGELRHDRVETQRKADYRFHLPVEALWLRAEYQTLHKLPESGAILFTVKILARALRSFADDPEGRGQLRALDSELATLSPEGAAYKGLTGKVDEIRAWLAQHHS